MTPSNLNPLLRIVRQNAIDLQHQVGIRLCISGQATIRLNHRRFSLQRGALYIVSPLIVREMEGASDDFEELDFLMPLEAVFSAFQRVVDHIVHLNIPQHPCLTLDEAAVEEYVQVHQAQALRRAQVQEAASPTQRDLHMQAYEAHFKTLLLDTLARFAAKIEAATPTEQTVAQRTMSRFLILLQLNFTRERAVKFYAHELGLSAGHFTTLIKEQTGKTPSEWIATLTMTQARNLLQYRDASIKEVAAQLGFPDQFAFGKYFKLHEGCSPKEFRARAQSEREGT